MSLMRIRCPCCEKEISVDLVTGEVVSDFFNAENSSEISEKIKEFGYEFGVMKGGELKNGE